MKYVTIDDDLDWREPFREWYLGKCKQEEKSLKQSSYTSVKRNKCAYELL